MDYEIKKSKEIVEKAMDAISSGASIEMEIEKAVYSALELGKTLKVEVGGKDESKGND